MERAPRKNGEAVKKPGIIKRIIKSIIPWKGDTVGTVEYYLGNSLVGTSDLKVHENVDRSLLMLVVGKFQEAYSSLYFRTVLCVSAVLIALYLVMLVIVNKRNDKKQKIRRRR